MTDFKLYHLSIIQEYLNGSLRIAEFDLIEAYFWKQQKALFLSFSLVTLSIRKNQVMHLLIIV